MTKDQISWIVLGATLIVAIAFVLIYSRFVKKANFSWIRFIARVAIFSALSTILYIVKVFEVHLPFLPPFLALHFDEIPAFIAGYAYGPYAALIVILVKTIIKLPFTSTLAVGELADFIFSCTFVLPATFVYKKIRNFKGVFIGLGISVVLQVVVAMVMNVYAILPFYIQVMGMTEEMILGMCQKANPSITNIDWSYAFLAVMPLNLIKDAIVIFVTFIIYRGIHKTLRWETPESKEQAI